MYVYDVQDLKTFLNAITKSLREISGNVDYLGRAVIRGLYHAIYQIIRCLAFTQFSRPVFLYNLAEVVVRILLKKFWAAFPACTAAYAAIAIYHYLRHELPP
jgi:hypothetical protein